MIVIDGQILKVETLADKSIKVTLVTQELSGEKAGQLIGVAHQHVYFALKAEAFLKDELAAVENMRADLNDTKVKSPSKRLRDVLFRLWEQNNDGIQDWELFYVTRIDRIVQQIKDKLETI